MGFRHAIGIGVLLSLHLAANVRAADDSPPERQPVPNSAAQSPIVNAIRAQYRQDYARRDAASQLELALNFQQQAAASADPVRQYVLLREARELATNAGNFDAAFSIVDDTARLFVFSADELKATVLANALDRSLLPKTELLENYLKVCDRSLGAGDVQRAYQCSLMATQIARATRDQPLIQRVKQYELRVHEARREQNAVVAAAGKLKADPDDAEANRVVGRYLCYVQGRWEDGLPLLARGSDSRLKALAEKDIEHPADADAMADLADHWWDLPDSPQAPQKRSRERAAYWYGQAIDQLSGERKARAQQRISQNRRDTRALPATEKSQ